jgi:hypothetical protein
MPKPTRSTMTTPKRTKSERRESAEEMALPRLRAA